MVAVRIITPNQEHIDDLAPRLKHIDKLECYYMGGLDINTSIRLSVKQSETSYVALVDGVPQVIWGIVPMSNFYKNYRPWMLSSDWIFNNKKLFWYFSLKYVHEMKKKARYLENHVLADNKFSIRWLKHLGFTIHEIQVINGKLWNKFSMEI